MVNLKFGLYEPPQWPLVGGYTIWKAKVPRKVALLGGPF